MLNESENPEIRSIIIEEIVKKIKKIIDQIQNQSPSECLQQIEDWLNQIKPESLTNDISHFSGVLDILSLYLQVEVSNDKKVQVEGCLGIILSHFNQLPPEKIVILTTALNKYIHADDKDELEKHLEKLGTNSKNFFFINTTEKKIPLLQEAKNIASAYVTKLKYSLNINSSSKSENIPLATPPMPRLISECKSESEIDYAKNKVIPSLIYFDKNGGGHRVKFLSKIKKKPRDFLESEDLNFNEFIDERQRYEDNLAEIEKTVGKEFSRLAEIEIPDDAETLNKNLKTQLSLKDKETELFRRLDTIEKARAKKNKIRILSVKNAKRLKKLKIWGPALASIQERINLIKDQQLNFKDQDILDNICTNLLSLEGYINKQLVREFLNYIDYKNLNILVKIARETYNLLEDTGLILNQIDNVRENLGFEKKYINYFQQDLETFARLFSNDFILNYLKNSFSIYWSMKFISNEFIQFPVYELKKISEGITLKIPTVLTTLHTIDKIIYNQRQTISIYLEKNYKNNNLYQQKILTRSLYNNKNKFKELIKKIKHFLINLFTIRFYFIDENYFSGFMQKLNKFIEDQNQGNLTIASVSKFVKMLNWKTLISYGINPMHLYKRDIMERLVQFLFLSIINQRLQIVTKNYSNNIDDNLKQKESDELFQLVTVLSRGKILNYFDNNQNNLIDKVESREKVLTKLQADEEVKDLLKKIPMLKSRVHLCRDELTKLCNFVDSAYVSLKKLEDDINPEIVLPLKNLFFTHPPKNQVDKHLFNPKLTRGCK